MALSGTGCDLTEEGRGGEGGQGKGERGEEREEEGRGAINLISSRHVRSRAFRYMHGPQGASAGTRAQSHARTRPEPQSATHAHPQSHARTRTDELLHEQ